MKLTNRLQLIADLIPKDSVIADIGTDHGYLPVYLVENGIIKKAIASDVNEGPVDNAKKTIEEEHVEENIEVRLGSGLSTIEERDNVDTVVIAGMGGTLIANLIDAEIEKVKKFDRLILQPMTTKIDLRKYLIYNGFEIISEHVAIEGEKIYEIIVSRYGSKEIWEEIYYDIGKKFDTSSPEYLLFIQSKLEKYKEIALKIEKNGKGKSNLKKNEILEKINIIEKLISQIK